MVVKRQIGVSLPNHVKHKLYKISRIEQRSVSSLCAEAIYIYMEKWLLRARRSPEDKLREIEKQ